jgi:hypothetical protein
MATTMSYWVSYVVDNGQYPVHANLGKRMHAYVVYAEDIYVCC